MEILSPYIVAAALGWIVAQCAKYIIYSFRKGKLASARLLYKSGRMPSSHSATSVALLVVVAALDGVQSGLFGLALLFTSVVVYDSVMVRRSSGEQGIALTELIKEQNSKVPFPRVARGHTPIEVAVGSLIGAIVGISVLAFYNIYM